MNDTNKTVELEEFESSKASDLLGEDVLPESDEAGLEAMYGIPITVSAVLGETKMPIKQLLKLGRGAVIELDRKVGEAIDIYVNNRLIARGEVVIVEDKLGVTMTEIVKSEKVNSKG
ncbi:MAG TPA: flagellar motor switch protein FliN [Alphaproteobacteria bacterium]|nr:flagellar motor switch protein FliN [Alphaproteobacteria bacterium]